jgi:uncharacterized protein YjgD (DUF1641 family)
MMAQPIEFKPAPASPAEAARRKLETAPAEHAEALLKAYALLDAAEKHGILDLLRGAISAEDKILEKVADYASTTQGINTLRNLLILGKFIGSLDPDWLGQGAKDLTDTLLLESTRRPRGFLPAAQRLRKSDAQRGLSIAIAALESIGRTARIRSKRLGEEK